MYLGLQVLFHRQQKRQHAQQLQPLHQQRMQVHHNM